MLPRVPFNFYTYFLEVATKLIPVGHVSDAPGEKALFQVSSIADAFDFISGTTTTRLPSSTALLIQEGLDGAVFEPKSNNEIDRQFYQFWILQHAPGDDYAQRQVVYKNCKALYNQIKARMRLDKVNNVKGLYYLDLSSFTYSTVPPVGDSYMGISVLFTLAEPDAVTIDPAQWLP